MDYGRHQGIVDDSTLTSRISPSGLHAYYTSFRRDLSLADDHVTISTSTPQVHRSQPSCASSSLFERARKRNTGRHHKILTLSRGCVALTWIRDTAHERELRVASGPNTLSSESSKGCEGVSLKWICKPGEAECGNPRGRRDIPAQSLTLHRLASVVESPCSHDHVISREGVLGCILMSK